VVLSTNFQKLNRCSNPLDATLVVKLRVQELPPGAYGLVLLGVDSANYQAPQKEIEFTISN
jgi:hypothetical protein